MGHACEKNTTTALISHLYALLHVLRLTVIDQNLALTHTVQFSETVNNKINY